MNILERIEKAWEATPAVVAVKEISRKSQLPSWEDCEKNAVYFGVIRRKRGDRVIIVKHKICHDLGLSMKAEELSEYELFKFGFVPTGDQICEECKEFSTRINIGNICTDCLPKQSGKGGTA